MNINDIAIFGMALVLIVAVGSSVLAADAQAAGPEGNEVRYSKPANPGVLGTTFVDWDSLVPRYTPVGRSMAVFDNPTATLDKFEVHITTLRPGMLSHAVHHHAWEEMLLIKQGNVELSINGKKYPAGPGFLVFFASNDPHNFKNVGSTDATYYVINFVTDRVRSAVDRPASEQAVPGKLTSSVIDCDGLPKTATPSGFRTPILDSPTLTFQRLVVHITTLNTGQRTRADMVDPGDELFIVRSGILEATVSGITARMKEGSLFYCAPNEKRTFRNIGSEPANYEVFKVMSDKSPR